METYDLNIDNYDLEDLLNLFHLPPDFSKNDLKKAHMMALQMHPDKSHLDSKYFIFFSKAYKLLARIYYFRFRETKMRPQYNVDMGKDEKKILQNLENQTKSKEFNIWFNKMFEKVKMTDEENDSGYENWFRDMSDATDMKKNRTFSV